MDRRHFVFAGVTLGTMAAAARASAPSRVLVGFAPGGTLDVITRALVESLRAQGISCIVDNRVGASGKLAIEGLLGSPADGQTLLVAPSTQVTLLPFTTVGISKVLTDVVPLGAAAQCYFGLAVQADTGPKTLAEFLSKAKSDPKSAFYAVPGTGTTMDFLGQALARKSGVELSSIPYKGGIAALNDLIGGVVPAVITATPNLAPMARAGKIRLLGVTSEAPVPTMPGVPTFASQGFPELNAAELICMFARKGTSQEQIDIYAEALRTIVESSSARDVMERQEYVPQFVSPAELSKKLAQDASRWQAVVKAAGFKPK